jgi:hypothetical protein
MFEPDEIEIDWHAVTDRLEAAIAERALEHEPGARDAVAFCRRCATIGEPLGEFMRRPDPLLDFCARCGLSLDAILLG